MQIQPFLRTTGPRPIFYWDLDQNGQAAADLRRAADEGVRRGLSSRLRRLPLHRNVHTSFCQNIG